MPHGEPGTELAQVWIPGRELQEEREIVRRRLKLSESNGRVKNGIPGLPRMHNIKRPEDMKTAWSKKRVAWLRELTKATTLGVSVRAVLESCVRELEFVEREIETLQKAVEPGTGEPSRG